MEIVLKVDDPKIGIPGKPPTTDVLGNPYERPPLHRAELGQGRYAVLPIFMDEVITVRLEGQPSPVEVAAETATPNQTEKQVMEMTAEEIAEVPAENASSDQVFDPTFSRKGK